jgi:hypothetical protein
VDGHFRQRIFNTVDYNPYYEHIKADLTHRLSDPTFKLYFDGLLTNWALL